MRSLRGIANTGQLVLIISVIASVTTLGGVFYPSYLSPSNLSGLDELTHQHQVSSISDQHAEAAPLPRMIDDLLQQNVKAGDAVNNRNLVIEEDFIDPDNHCEFCQRYEYTPGSAGRAGIAYGNDGQPVDFSGAKKVFFFVMGEEGGEKVKFKVGGKDTNADATGVESGETNNQGKQTTRDSSSRASAKSSGEASNTTGTDDLFAGKAFAKTTDEVSLTDDWKRYEIDLNGVDMRNSENPFAIEVLKSGSGKQVFYVKGITFDTEPAIDPLPTVGINTTLSASNLTASNQTEISGLNGTANSTDTDAARVDDNNTGIANATTLSDDNETLSARVEAEETTTGDGEPENATGGASSNESDSNALIEEEIRTAENQKPTASPVPDEIIAHPGDSIVLDGSSSEDPDDDSLTFSWEALNNEIEVTENADSPTPTVTISSDIEDDTELSVELTVSDGELASEPSEVTIVVDYFESTEPPESDEFSDAEESQVQSAPVERSDLRPEIDEVGEVDNWDPNNDCSEDFGDGSDDIAGCLGDDSDNTLLRTDEQSADVFLFDTPEELHAGTDGDGIFVNYISGELTARVSSEADDEVSTGFVSFVLFDDKEGEFYVTPAISISSDEFENYSYRWPTSPNGGSEWHEVLEQSVLVGYLYSAGNSTVEISEFTITASYYEASDDGSDETEDAESEEQPTSEDDVDEDTEDEPAEEESSQTDSDGVTGNSTSDSTPSTGDEEASANNQNGTSVEE